VSTNGAISFTTQIPHYRTEQFPMNWNNKIIAPFWADVDTTGIGNVSYRMTTNADLLRRANNAIKRAFPIIKFSSHFLFIATWNRVGFYDSQTYKVKCCHYAIMH